MNLTALGFVFIYILGLTLAFARHPFFGLLTYFWVFYNHPSSRWWGYALPYTRWALWAALFTWVAVLLAGIRPRRQFFFPTLGAKLVFVWTLLFWVQSFWAIDSEYHMEGSILVSKYFILFLLIQNLVVNDKDFEWFLFFNVLGGFVFGWIAYTDGGGAGRFESVGVAGMDDANSLGVYFAVWLGIGGFLFLRLQDWRKWIVLACIPFILNGLILTSSRGAFLSLVCGGIVAVTLIPREKRKNFIVVGALGLILLSILGHDLFWDRMETILPDEHGTVGGSAGIGRKEIAAAGWEMAKDYPLGTGYYGHKILSPQYLSEVHLAQDSGTRAAHNSFMQALVEQGFVGAIIYFFIWVWAGWTIWKLKFLNQFDSNGPFGLYRAALGVGLAAFFVGGQTHSFLNGELWFWLLALLSSLSASCHQSVVIPPPRQATSGQIIDTELLKEASEKK